MGSQILDPLAIHPQQYVFHKRRPYDVQHAVGHVVRAQKNNETYYHRLVIGPSQWMIMMWCGANGQGEVWPKRRRLKFHDSVWTRGKGMCSMCDTWNSNTPGYSVRIFPSRVNGFQFNMNHIPWPSIRVLLPEGKVCPWSQPSCGKRTTPVTMTVDGSRMVLVRPDSPRINKELNEC